MSAYDPAKKVQYQVVSQSPHSCAWRLWRALPGDTEWTAVDDGTKDTPQKEYGTFPAGTKLLYALLIGGNANTDWKMRVSVLQEGTPLDCAPQVETGFMTDTVARRDTAFMLR